MIRIYVLLFLLTAFLMLVCGVYIVTKHTIRHSKLSISVMQLLAVGIFTCVAYSVAISSRTELQSEIGYTMYFAGIDWILITFLFYSRQYTRVWQENYAAPLITTTIAVVDNVSLIFNYKWHHAFWLERKDIGSEWFFDFKINDYYIVHLVFCYILVALIVLIFVQKTLMTSGFHRNRYLSILVMFVGIIAINVVYLFFDYPVDVSICLYSIAAMFVSYYTLLYNPKTFVEYMLSTITERMECALISFDEYDNCIYSNQLANRMFSPSGDKRLIEQRFKRWRDGKETNAISNTNWNEIYTFNSEEYRYDVHFNKIYDRKGFYCGCYFSFYDVTGDFLAYEEEKYRSSHDSLTGALNRESFYEEVRRVLDENPDREYVMACCNIKGFKLINDM